jgi:hypothetical protein
MKILKIKAYELAYEFKELKPEAKKRVIEKLADINVRDFADFSAEDIIINAIVEIKEKTGLCLDYKTIEWEILSRENRIFIPAGDLCGALRNKYPSFSNWDLPKNFGLYCNYLGGGMNSGLIASKFNTELIEFETQYTAGLEETIEIKQQQKIKEDIKKDCEIILSIFEKTYKNLYDDYNYLASEKAIKDTIEANNYLFNADGGIV